MKPSSIFQYYGGKFNYLEFLYRHFPEHICYVEPFGGSAVVLLNKKLSKVEVYNDLYSDVVNFFRVLREQPEELQRQLELTLYSREEHDTARIRDKSLSDLENARRFFTEIRQSISGVIGNAWSYCILTSNSQNAKTVDKWNNSIAKIPKFAERFKSVQIENLPAVEVIKKYDTPDTFFYCDPPYVMDTRVGGSRYQCEMTDEEHIELSEVLKKVKGKVAISGYNGELYKELYKDWILYQKETRTSASVIKTGDKKRVECLWTNYEDGEQLEMF